MIKKVLEMFGEPITYGGQESVVYNMLSSFDLQKFKIDLFTPYFADNLELTELVKGNGGLTHSLNLEFKLGDNRFLLTKHIAKFFENFHDYDVVHIHTGSLTTMLVFARLVKKFGIKKVIVHSHTTGNRISILTRVRNQILCYFLDKYVDIYLGCSLESLKFKFTDKIVNKGIVVNNGIDVDKFKFNSQYRSEIRNQYNINSDFVIGSLGRMSFEKNNAFMIEIINRLIKIDNLFKLLIVGNGDKEKSIKDLVNELRLDDYAIFAGKQSLSYKYYDAFDCFVLPSLYEGMPVTSIEAQISGLPTIISNNVTREANISSGTVYLSIDNVDDWVDCILKLKQNVNGDRNNYEINFDKFDKNKTYSIVEKIYLS